MMTFWEYLKLCETEIPLPPGVDPEMWANPTFQKSWLIQHPEYLQSQQPVQQQPVQQPMNKFAARVLKQGTPGIPQDTRYTKVPTSVYNKWKHEYDRLPQDILKWFSDQGFRWGSISGKPGTYRWMPPVNYAMPN